MVCEIKKITQEDDGSITLELNSTIGDIVMKNAVLVDGPNIFEPPKTKNGSELNETFMVRIKRDPALKNRIKKHANTLSSYEEIQIKMKENPSRWKELAGAYLDKFRKNMSDRLDYTGGIDEQDEGS